MKDYESSSMLVIRALILLAVSTLFIGCSHANIRSMNAPDSSVKRKGRTEEYLKSLGVPVNSHLPLVEDETRVRLREPKEVAKRAVILYALIMVAHQYDREHATSWLKDEGLWDSVSPKEKDFLENSNAPEKDRIEASWRAESLWTLLWALRKIERLDLPKEMCDSHVIRQIMPALESSSAQFVNEATLRSPAEILDATDLTYRIHWAVAEANLNQREMPGGFHPGIVYERHYALNWLTWYADEWDDITTDT